MADVSQRTAITFLTGGVVGVAASIAVSHYLSPARSSRQGAHAPPGSGIEPSRRSTPPSVWQRLLDLLSAPAAAPPEPEAARDLLRAAAERRAAQQDGAGAGAVGAAGNHGAAGAATAAAAQQRGAERAAAGAARAPAAEDVEDEILAEHFTRNTQFFGREGQNRIARSFVVVVGLGVSCRQRRLPCSL